MVWGVLEVDGVPAGPDKRSALVWRAGGVEVVGVGGEWGAGFSALV